MFRGGLKSFELLQPNSFTYIPCLIIGTLQWSNIFLYFLFINLIHYEQKSLYRKNKIISGSFDIDVHFYFDQILQCPYCIDIYLEYHNCSFDLGDNRAHAMWLWARALMNGLLKSHKTTKYQRNKYLHTYLLFVFQLVHSCGKLLYHFFINHSHGHVVDSSVQKSRCSCAILRGLSWDLKDWRDATQNHDMTFPWHFVKIRWVFNSVLSPQLIQYATTATIKATQYSTPQKMAAVGRFYAHGYSSLITMCSHPLQG